MRFHLACTYVFHYSDVTPVPLSLLSLLRMVSGFVNSDLQILCGFSLSEFGLHVVYHMDGRILGLFAGSDRNKMEVHY